MIGESADEKVAKQGNHSGPYQATYRLPEQITKADVLEFAAADRGTEQGDGEGKSGSRAG